MQADDSDNDQLSGAEASDNDESEPEEVEFGDSSSEAPSGPFEYGNPAYLGDKAFCRIVVIALASGIFVAVCGIALLSACDKDIPEGLTAIGSASVGGLAGVLTARR